jgi:hypothetical protein
VLDGLEGAAAGHGGAFDRPEMEKVLAGLGSRVFLMNNVHDDHPEIFETRWAMSYLRGPLTRAQIRQLMEPKRAVTAPSQAAAPKPAAVKGGPGIEERFVPVRGTAPDAVYEAVLLGAATVRFVDVKRGIDQPREGAWIAPLNDGAVPVDWNEAAEAGFDIEELETAPVDGASFAGLPAPAAQAKNYKTWQREFANWLYASQSYDLFHSPSTGETSAPGESERDFRLRLQQVAREQRDLAVETLRQKYAARIRPLEDRLFRAQQAVEREKQQASSQTLQSALSIGASVLGAIFGGSRRTSIGKVATGVRTAGRAFEQRQDVGRAEDTVERLQEQIQAIQGELEAEITQVQSGPDVMTEQFEVISVKPKKTNISVKLVSLVWRA